MKILNIFDAALEGTFNQFMDFYNGNANQVNIYTKLNLLTTIVINDKFVEDKIKIANFLIKEGIDINFIDSKFSRNALHHLLFNFRKGSIQYAMNMCKLLCENGIDVNALDKFNSIPMKYSITISKLSTDEMMPIYFYLLEVGSDYNYKDKFGKSCMEYATEYSWRNSLVDIVKEYENEKRK